MSIFSTGYILVQMIDSPQMYIWCVVAEPKW